MCLVTYIFTHILMYWYAGCNCKLWKVPWFYCVFWVFSYIFDDHLCLTYYISTKLSQIVSPDHFSDSIAFFWNFHILQHVWNVIALNKEVLNKLICKKARFFHFICSTHGKLTINPTHMNQIKLARMMNLAFSFTFEWLVCAEEL